MCKESEKFIKLKKIVPGMCKIEIKYKKFDAWECECCKDSAINQSIYRN